VDVAAAMESTASIKNSRAAAFLLRGRSVVRNLVMQLNKWRTTSLPRYCIAQTARAHATPSMKRLWRAFLSRYGKPELRGGANHQPVGGPEGGCQGPRLRDLPRAAGMANVMMSLSGKKRGTPVM
jgi:hypothetical protein